MDILSIFHQHKIYSLISSVVWEEWEVWAVCQDSHSWVVALVEWEAWVEWAAWAVELKGSPNQLYYQFLAHSNSFTQAVQKR